MTWMEHQADSARDHEPREASRRAGVEEAPTESPPASDRLDPIWRGFRAADAGISLKIRGDARATLALALVLVVAILAVVAVIGGDDLLAQLSAVADEAR